MIFQSRCFSRNGSICGSSMVAIFQNAGLFPFASYLTLNNTVTLKYGLEVTQGQ